MYEKIMKNLNLRQKFIVIYFHMTIWTIPIVIGAIVIINKMGTNSAWQVDNVMKFYIITIVIYLALYVGCTVIMGRALTKEIVFPLRETIGNIKKIATGDVRVEFKHEGRKDEVSVMISTLEEMTRSMQREVEIIKRIADGDYTEEITLRDSHDVIFRSFQEIQDKNNKFISEIRNAAIQISTGAGQIAGGAQNLANGSNEQAATIEQFGSSIAVVKMKADENAAIAQDTIKSIDANTKLMQDNIDEIKKVNTFIDELAGDSKKIAKVIKVIDDIAFQTNILALNAAVEAARAGQHGKGFAVVADEVRDLASKSAQAAKETSDLIKKSLDSVDAGSRLVEKTNIGIEQMGDIALKNQESMTNLSEASIEQGISIAEIDKGIAQISDVVQANSSMAEESAAAAQEMSAQSDYLNIMISKFNTKESDINMNLDSYDRVSPTQKPHAPAKTEPVVVADTTDFPQDTRSVGPQFVDVTGPEMEDYSKIVVPNKYTYE